MSGSPADILTIFYYGSFLPVANGGNARLVDLLDRLTHEFGRIVLYSFADHPDFPWTAESAAACRDRWPTVELVLENRGRMLPQITRLKNLLLTVVPQRWAAAVLAFSLPGATPRWSALRQGGGAVVVSYAEGLTQVNGLDPGRSIVETHDVNFVKWSKLHGHRPVSLTALRKLRGEMTALGTTCGLVAISVGEAAFFRMMLAGPVAFVPRWSVARSNDQPRPADSDFDLVFVGSAYEMNVRGFCAMLEAHGPRLSRYRIAVCGHVAEDEAVRRVTASYPNIVLLGFVENLDDVLRRSRAALSPVDGTGTKMKVLAALDAGLPVFASRQSREGLPAGHEGAVFPLTPDAIDDLLGSDDRMRSARECVRHYSDGLRSAGESGAVIDWLHGMARNETTVACKILRST